MAKPKSSKELKTGDLFAISTGSYLGEFFVFIERKSSIQYFLSLPKMINRQIDEKQIDHALSTGILEFQENLPDDVKKVCTEQHIKNNDKTIRRRK